MTESPVVNQVRHLTEATLKALVQETIEECVREFDLGESDLDLAGGLAEQLKEGAEEIVARFNKYLGHCFDRLTTPNLRKIEQGDYPTPSIVDDHFLEAANALEGMINYARQYQYPGADRLQHEAR